MPAERAELWSETLDSFTAGPPDDRIATLEDGGQPQPGGQDVVACNCVGSDDCGTGPDGQKTVCKVGGCYTWTGNDGRTRIGMCVYAPPPSPTTPTPQGSQDSVD